MASGFEDLDYVNWLAGSTESARVAIPLILEATAAKSVVDVGCGLGAWLAVFREHGIGDILGYDGPWVDRSRLLVAPGEFRGVDLRGPIPVDRRFDLALCLEVANVLGSEHAAPLVEALTSLAGVVVFSAGIPGQGGWSDVNEHWPAEWAELFEQHGYLSADPFRLRLWEEPEVKWWFAQNMLVFAEPAAFERLPVLAATRCNGAPLPLVHPGCLRNCLDQAETLRATLPARRRRRRRRSSTT